jgi:hypothetical protein
MTAQAPIAITARPKSASTLGVVIHFLIVAMRPFCPVDGCLAFAPPELSAPAGEMPSSNAAANRCRAPDPTRIAAHRDGCRDEHRPLVRVTPAP